jgi:enamine deaminase RidA (YjgF/YER057c/UK114 family)
MDRDFGPLNEAYIDFLKTNSSTPPPSRTCIQAGKLPGAGIIVEIECIAAA